MTWITATKGEFLTPPILLLPNVELDTNSQLALTHSLIIAPFKARRDEGLFDQLLNEHRLEKRAILFQAPDAPDLVPTLIDRFRLLLSLHPLLEDFNPGRIDALELQFHRAATGSSEPDSPKIRGNLLLNGVPLSREDATAAILGTAMRLPRQKAPARSWASSADLFSLHEEPDDASVFSLALHHLLHCESDQFWRALRLFSLGVQQAALNQHDIASALIIASLEALLPTQGRDAVVAQFKAIGSMLVPHPGIPKWLDQLYDIRSRILHEASIEGVHSGKARLGKLIRDVELAKYIYLYSAVQLDQLSAGRYQLNAKGVAELPNITFEDEECEQRSATKQVWLKRINERLTWDNRTLVDAIAKTDWKPEAHAGLRFYTADETVSQLDLIATGLRFLSLYVQANAPEVSLSVIQGHADRYSQVVKLLNVLAEAEEPELQKRKKVYLADELSQLCRTIESASKEISQDCLMRAVRRVDEGVVSKFVAKLSAEGVEGIIGEYQRELLAIMNALRGVVALFAASIAAERHEEGGIVGFEGLCVVWSWLDMINDWNVRSAEVAETLGVTDEN